MNLYLLRHADAVPLGENGATSDEDRPLSDKGIEQAALLAQGLKHMNVVIDTIVSSPLLRTVQTAEELRRKLDSAVEIQTCLPLVPGGTSKKLLKCLRKLGGENVLLVGHEPDLSRHLARLIGSKRTGLEFAKAGIACVSCDEAPRKGTGTLLWLVTPDWLRMPQSAAPTERGGSEALQ